VSAEVVLTFPARAEYLILPRLALAGIARAVPIEEEVLADLKLAVTEACGNVVRHAYGDDDGPVRVTIALAEGAVTISVADDGAGIAAERPAGRADGEGGMGLAIIGAIADELDVRPGAAGGTVLTLRKTLTHVQPASPATQP
jgi:serine/threonine-protein kinase RsbW